ncbi:MAG TPA: sodium-independent anion transporter, partial [Roseiarcus sp.]|nr:sodium-independent anion transporter [Roseiarcus sp.]
TTIAGFARKARRRGALVFIAGASGAVRRALLTHGVRPPDVRYRARLPDAFAAARRETAADPPEPAAARPATA